MARSREEFIIERDDDDDENTPGFMASTMVLAALGAILFMGRRRSL